LKFRALEPEAASMTASPTTKAPCLLVALVLLCGGPLGAGAALDPDALSQRYRNWTYYPSWVIPPACLNPATCPGFCKNATGEGCCTDVMQLVQLPGEAAAGVFRAFYLQFDGTGYETYSASTTDMVHFQLDNPTLVPGQPGIVFSPRAGRPPMADPKPAVGDWDYGSQSRYRPPPTHATLP